MPATELAGRIRQLPPDSQTARAELGPQLHDYARGLSYLNANVARLVDLVEFLLNHEYASWTADPDEVEAERRKRKRAGIKPPPIPLIQPVAARPDEVHEQLVDEYADLLVEHGQAAAPAHAQLVSTDEWDHELGLD